MKYYSTNKIVSDVALKDAVIKSLAADKGLFMPNSIKRLPQEFFDNIENMSFQEMSYRVADAFFGEDLPADELKRIVYETLAFDAPVVKVKDNIYSLELFHGPTLAFKDVGGRFMARLLGYFVKNSQEKRVNVLVATSGDTGSAVANGFLGVKGVHVYVLYPKGKVSEIQEKQFTTLGKNITALEIEGCFDDCQALVKRAFADEELNAGMFLTSANSINLGNITAGLFAQVMGLPIKRFIAANNRNDIFYNYLRTGNFEPKASVCTIANAMDVGNPSNFARILDLYNYNHATVCSHVGGATYNDEQIANGVKDCWKENKYLLDPHGACGYLALQEQLQAGETGVFLETAHPAKFKDTIDRILGEDIEIPLPLQEFMKGKKQTVEMSNDYEELKKFLQQNQNYNSEECYY